MLGYVLRRLGMLLPVLLGVSFVVFLALHLVPGDPATAMLGERATPEAVAALREQLGLNDPFPVQYVRFLGRITRGNLGRSIQSNNAVTSEIWLRFPATVELTLAAMALAVLLGVPAGVLSAARQYTLVDHLSMAGALVGVSMPIFWLGLVLIILFASLLPLFPISGRIDVAIVVPRVTGFLLADSIFAGDGRALWESARYLALPGLTLSTVPMAIIARMTRSCMLESMRQDFVRTARAKGLAEGRVVMRHALRNALIPVITVIGLQFGYLLGGAILTETIFAWPGLGRLTVDAINARDYPLVQGAVLLFAVTFVVVNLAVDLVYGAIDPRIRYREAGR